MFRVYAQHAKNKVSATSKVKVILDDDDKKSKGNSRGRIGNEGDTSKTTRGLSNGKKKITNGGVVQNNNNNKMTTKKKKRRRRAIWLFRFFFVASVTSLLGMIFIEIPTSITLITGDDSDSSKTTLTLRASLSAEISSQQNGRSSSWWGTTTTTTPSTSLSEREMMKDCQHQASMLDKAVSKIDPKTTTTSLEDWNQLISPLRKTHCGALWNNALLSSSSNNNDDDNNSRDKKQKQKDQQTQQIHFPTHNDNRPIHIEVVVSYCINPLYWLLSDLEELKQEASTPTQNVTVSVTVFSKCDQELKIFDYTKSATFDVKVYTLPNDSGTHHHTYAYWMSQYAQDVAMTTDFVFFLTDQERGIHKKRQNGKNGRKSHSLIEMLRMAATPPMMSGGDTSNNSGGFACGSSQMNGGLILSKNDDEDPSLPSLLPSLVSTYHCTNELAKYSLKSIPKRYTQGFSKRDRAKFASNTFTNMGDFVQAILLTGSLSSKTTTSSDDEKDVSTTSTTTTNSNNNALWNMVQLLVDDDDNDDKKKSTTSNTFIPVCYDDTFVVSMDHIMNRNPIIVYETMTKLLNRGKAWAFTEEALFAERMWAGLFTSSTTTLSDVLNQFGTSCRSGTVSLNDDDNDSKKYESIYDNDVSPLRNYAGAFERPLFQQNDDGDHKKKLRYHQQRQKEQKMVKINGGLYPENVAEMIKQMQAGKSNDIIGKDVSIHNDKDKRKSKQQQKKQRHHDEQKEQKMVKIGGGFYPENVAGMILQMKAGRSNELVGKDVSTIIKDDYDDDEDEELDDEDEEESNNNNNIQLSPPDDDDGGGSTNGVPNYILKALRDMKGKDDHKF